MMERGLLAVELLEQRHYKLRNREMVTLAIHHDHFWVISR
jgi:hypothetical protein